MRSSATMRSGSRSRSPSHAAALNWIVCARTPCGPSALRLPVIGLQPGHVLVPQWVSAGLVGCLGVPLVHHGATLSQTWEMRLVAEGCRWRGGPGGASLLAQFVAVGGQGLRRVRGCGRMARCPLWASLGCWMITAAGGRWPNVGRDWFAKVPLALAGVPAVRSRVRSG